MKGSQNMIASKEERDDCEAEWEAKSHKQDHGATSLAPPTKMANNLFYDYNYDELREKKLKALRYGRAMGPLHGKKIANMIEAHWQMKKEKKEKEISEEMREKEEKEVKEKKVNGEVQGYYHAKEEEEVEAENINNFTSTANPQKITAVMEGLKEDIEKVKSLLNKKRENIVNANSVIRNKQKEEEKFKNDIFFDDYDLFLFNFYYESRVNRQEDIRDDMKSLNFKQTSLNNKSYLYLYKKMKQVVLGDEGAKIQNKFQKIKSGKKAIGITPEDIFKVKKCQVDLSNMPKFSRFFDKLTSEDMEYSGPKTRICLDSSFSDKHKKKHQTLSFIERQNTEALRSIEEKRQKFRHLPKSNKEKMDNNNLHKHWSWIVKKEIPKMYKIYQKYKNDVDYNCKKFSNLAQKEVKKKVSKVQRLQKETNVRAKRLYREMIVFWRKRDKEIQEIKKRKDKYEVEKKKREDEIQDMIMQKKRLEFLMKQSDIYSFFMIRNMGMIDQTPEEENKEVAEGGEQKKLNTEIVGGTEVGINPKTNKAMFHSIKVDVDEKAAKEGVKQMIKMQRERMMKFDQQTNRIREKVGADKIKLKSFDEEGEELEEERLDKPTINASSQLIEAPRSFLGELKEYQLKGLRWLDNLYDQGINGILADEMGLGKTIQAIAFLAHLSEEKGNWGPFLVVAPNATLYNWQQELNKFCPSLKVLPYWGGLKERKTLRKFFNSQNLYSKNAAFHVCVTSYQLVVSDEKVFHRENWQYMILDEAQAIKNINSQRWNTLLSFNCRNRLLLSGTPIQNSMSELWALLHFIMPNLFDSHEQFQEWFSRDIEAHSQEKGELNQEQLNRLHKILKPFMLRRVKKDVENEIGPKVEYEILADMTERQKVLYNSIKEKLSNISDLFTSVDSKVKVENLMNLVMQFRKVCNHPELFERNLGKVPFKFRDLTFSRTSTFVTLPNSIAEMRIDRGNCIQYALPKMVYDLCYGNILSHFKKYSIYTYDNILSTKQSNKFNTGGLFNFIGLFNFSQNEFLNLINMDRILAQICLVHYLNELSCRNNYFKNSLLFDDSSSEINLNNSQGRLSVFINSSIFPINEERTVFYKTRNEIFPNRPLIVNYALEAKDSLYRQFNKHRFYIPKVIASPAELVCSSNRIKTEMAYNMNNLVLNKILYGSSFRQFNKRELKSIKQMLTFNNSRSNPYIEEILESGLLTQLFYKNEGYSQMELPSFDRLISDCAKLKKLDELLDKLKKEGHRVLIFCQMTRMIDILEEYMAKKRYTYFRMDGSTNIADRRDMVNEFQVNPKIFAFLLSTRAGGLGVNLTGADTVIFYDNDWNPTMDAQATDRAHRIGQKRVVSVYRLTTKNTIEERILKRAKQKQNVQTTVYAGGAFKADIFKQSEIVELLYSEEEVKRMEMEKKKLLDYTTNMPVEVISKDTDLLLSDPSLAADLATKKKSSAKKGKKESVKGEKSKKGKKAKETNIQPDASSKYNLQGAHAKAKSNIMQGRNIFAVTSSTSNPKPKVNTLKVDSSDDENNIIIQDGDNPIQIDEDNDMF